MSKKGSTRGGPRTPRPSQAPTPSRGVVVAAALVASLSVTGVWWGLTRPSSGPAPSAVATPAEHGPAGTAPTPTSSAPEAVKGRWQRADGGYVLEIRSVSADGALDALYFNPAPVNVFQARVTSTAGLLRVFVELRDANYPGSTYTLSYDSSNDLLSGEYFQAVQQQRFDVVFARQR